MVFGCLVPINSVCRLLKDAEGAVSLVDISNMLPGQS